MKGITRFEMALMNRDGLSREEAKEQLEIVLEDIRDLLENGCSLFEIEDYIMGEYGLEIDYLEEIFYML